MSTLSKIFRRTATTLYRWQYQPWIVRSCRTFSDKNNEGENMFSVLDEKMKPVDVKFPDISVEKVVSRDKAIQKYICTLPPDSCENSRILNVAIIGGPNVGKSTLVNDLLCRKVNAVSSKINTTRKNTVSAFTEDSTQIVFVDTPGLFAPTQRKKHNLDEQIGRDPERCLQDADIVGVVMDVSDKWKRFALNDEVIKLLHLYRHLPSFLILNKIDMLKSKELLLQVTRKLCKEVVGGVKIGSKVKTKSVGEKSNEKPTKFGSLFAELKQKYGEVEMTNETRMALKRIKVSEEGVSKMDENIRDEADKIDLSRGTFVDVDKYSDLGIDEDVGADVEKRKIHLLHQEKYKQEMQEKNVEKNKLENILAKVNVGDGAVSRDLIQTEKEEVHHLEMLERHKAAKMAVIKKEGWPNFQCVFMVSALLGEHTGDIKQYLLEMARPGPWKYHSCMVTQQDTFDIAKCKVWEKILEYVPGVIPYEVKISITYWNVVQNDDLMVAMEVDVPKNHYLVQLIGRKGMTMRQVCQEAEKALMDVFHCNVVLHLAATCNAANYVRRGTRHSPSRRAKMERRPSPV